ncbi:MAG: tRNA (N(6)-L-threonylcarbamoyladenosine(37)-C(2))-methylthiotransferase MtaB [Chloroflexota bacterium]|nr:tRNA (N(6)-L-threonylcarbamoyladenosine(37)-C(2))-methylthiotransferase MtaB [Chloroflexota bacterium]
MTLRWAAIEVIGMKVALYTLGCKLNQAETESLINQLSQAGHQIVAPNEPADIYIANTCTVTHIADRKSRHWLRLARKRNPHAFIIATGCYAQRTPQELAPLADLILGNEEKEHLTRRIKDLPFYTPSFPVTQDLCYTPSNNITRVRSLVKIQDGCQTPCGYCIVPLVRPHEYSLPVSHIIEEIKRKVTLGHKEIILTGTKVGCYSRDGMTLSGLVKHILNETDIERLRLSSLQPQEISPELLALWQDVALNTSKGFRLCRHFHLALQSGSDTVLRRMNRRYSIDDYVNTIRSINQLVPGVAITTDIIVGFPGESDEEFEQSYRLCKEVGFANIHIFPFSPRPGTQAAMLPNQVKDEVKKERTQQMLKLAWECRERFYTKFVGNILPILWEGKTDNGSGIYSGLTDNYIRVFTQSSTSLINETGSVMLAGFHNHEMWGLVNENPS